MTKPGVQRGYITAWKVAHQKPWVCPICDFEIEEHELVVHHLDENRSNNHLDNLEGLHQDCHAQLHMTGVPKSPEHATKVGAAVSKAWAEMPEERKELARQRMSAAKRGKPWTPARRAAHERRKATS